MISVTVLTKNSEKYLRQVLESLKLFKEVLVYDTGSKDQTLSIARQFPNVIIKEASFVGFGKTHNQASEAATFDWILSIDSDEVLTSELAQEILNLQLTPSAVYSIQRDNFYNGRWIRWCDWYPDRQIRLYNRKATQFNDAQVHESIISEGFKVIPLKGSLYHYSYACTADFLNKMQSYSDLFASQNAGKKTSSLSKAILHGFFAFFKNYIIKKGILGGKEGFIISFYNANTAFYKYLKLEEANRKLQSNEKAKSL